MNGENEVFNKKAFMRKYCPYGLEYFCDGTPNKSVNEKNTERKPCPKRYDCRIKSAEKVCKTLSGMTEMTVKVYVEVGSETEIIGIKENIATQIEEMPGVHAVRVANVKQV